MYFGLKYWKFNPQLVRNTVLVQLKSIRDFKIVSGLGLPAQHRSDYLSIVLVSREDLHDRCYYSSSLTCLGWTQKVWNWTPPFCPTLEARGICLGGHIKRARLLWCCRRVPSSETTLYAIYDHKLTSKRHNIGQIWIIPFRTIFFVNFIEYQLKSFNCSPESSWFACLTGPAGLIQLFDFWHVDVEINTCALWMVISAL